MRTDNLASGQALSCFIQYCGGLTRLSWIKWAPGTHVLTADSIASANASRLGKCMVEDEAEFNLKKGFRALEIL